MDRVLPPAACEQGALDLYDKGGTLIDRIIFEGDRHSLSIDLAHVVPQLLACPCHAVVLIHTHPSGHAEPSEADFVATQVFARLLRMLGIRLHDHIICAARGRFSFRSNGLL